MIGDRMKKKILILIIEAIRRKPLKEELEIKIQLLGFSLIIALSLYVTYIDIVINIIKPTDCNPTSTFSLNGFLRIPSNINKQTFPPSNGGNGNKFVIFYSQNRLHFSAKNGIII